MSKCIYEQSKYYQLAHADSRDIVDPHGYAFFHQNTEHQRGEPKHKMGPLQLKFLADKSITRVLSSRSTPVRDLEKFLVPSEIQRKPYFISSENLDLVNNSMNFNTLSALQSKYFAAKAQDAFSTLELALTLSSLNQDHFYGVKDYALTSYFLYFEGSLHSAQFLHNLLTDEHIEYDVTLLHLPERRNPFDFSVHHQQTTASSRLSLAMEAVNINDLSAVNGYIEILSAQCLSRDQNYSGVNLFVAASTVAPINPDVLNEEEEHLASLKYEMYLLTGVLADGQCAVLKIRGNYTHQTCEYLFLLRVVFGKVSLHKSILGNPFSNEKYVICETYSRENGRVVHEYLHNHYHHQQANWLLISAQAMFSQDFQRNITQFNNSCPLFKLYRELSKVYQANSNLEIYPNKQALLKAVEQLKFHKKDFMELVMEWIPEDEVVEEKKVDLFEDKKGIEALDCYTIFNQTPKISEKSDKVKPKQTSALQSYMKQIDFAQEVRRKEKAKRAQEKKKDEK